MTTNTPETTEPMTIDEYGERQLRARRAFVNERQKLIDQFLKEHSSEAEQLELATDCDDAPDVFEALAHSPFLSVRKAVLEATADGEYAYAWATMAHREHPADPGAEGYDEAVEQECQQEAEWLVRNHGESGDLVGTLNYIVNG